MAENGIDLVDLYYPSDFIWKSALDLGCQLDYSIYDCHYLSLAINHDAKLLALDKRLSKLAVEMGVSL